MIKGLKDRGMKRDGNSQNISTHIRFQYMTKMVFKIGEKEIVNKYCWKKISTELSLKNTFTTCPLPQVLWCHWGPCTNSETGKPTGSCIWRLVLAHRNLVHGVQLVNRNKSYTQFSEFLNCKYTLENQDIFLNWTKIPRSRS